MLTKNTNKKGKQILIELSLFIMLAAMMVGCTSKNYVPYETEAPGTTYESPADNKDNISLIEGSYDYDDLFDSPIPLDVAANFFAKVEAIWDEDDGDLWGIYLHAPLMFADAATRFAVANMPDPHGHLQRQGDVYVGTLPDGVIISNTASNFNDLLWGMMLWDHGGPTVEDIEEHDVVVMLIHEAFHVLQFNETVMRLNTEDLPHYANQFSPYLDYSADARILVFLEMKALKAAMLSDGDERLEAINDALSIRAERRRRYPEAYAGENLQEILEGLAVFTHILVFDSIKEFAICYFENRVEPMAEISGLGGQFPYFTGAAYALLLRDTGVNWQQGINLKTDLANLLKEALGIESLRPFEAIDVERYGYSEIAPVLQAFAEEFQRMRQAAKNFKEAPLLFIEGTWFFEYFAGYNEVISLPSGEPYQLDYLIFYSCEGNSFGSANWRLTMNARGFISIDGMAGLYVKLYEDIYVDENSMIAITPTWTLEITDDSYMIQLMVSGEIEIVRR